MVEWQDGEIDCRRMDGWMDERMDGMRGGG